MLFLRLAAFLLVMSGQTAALAQDQVTVRVNAGLKMAPFKPIYAFFGYDEPNYTYTKNASKLVRELAALTDAPVFLRTHFLLATGDGTPGLKWGLNERIYRRRFGQRRL
jgi:xylan 1,4-beta-xylosidase